MSKSDAKVPDTMRRPAPDAVQLKGLIGRRFHASRTNRLIRQEEEHLLWPFQRGCPVGYFPDPARQPYPGVRGDWQGEFLGTYLDAAVLSAWNAGDADLRAKIETLVADWLATQAPDGYLGTYAEADRWKSWDVWVQAHDLVGLLSYYHYTGSPEILEAAARIGRRVLRDFGPGKRSLRETGPHAGMASSAILEPLVWLYWETGETALLDFGRWLVEQDWEGAGGPRILSALLNGKGVAGVGNAKGIEMLLDIAGLLELYRATGEEKYLRAVRLAWEDIAAHHLYITGSASTGEYFSPAYSLPNEGIFMIGETCVSMGWMYLNFSLARLTGDARYLDMAEQTLYNHLMGAQSPDGQFWAYYVGLRDSKRYRRHTDPECCPTKGARGLAQALPHVFGLTGEGISLNLYDAAEADLALPSGRAAHLEVNTGYPLDGQVEIRLGLAESETFSLRLRLPGWCRHFTLAVNGAPLEAAPDELGYLALRRAWRSGDRVSLDLEMPINVAVDRIGNLGRAAVTRGPLVFAADAAYLPAGLLLDDLILALDGGNPGGSFRTAQDEIAGTLHLIARRAAPCPQTGAGLWREEERYHLLAPSTGQGGVDLPAGDEIVLVPFFEAGNRQFRLVEGIQPNNEPVRGITFQVWLPYRWT